ncbi:hypothetical protein [Trinickia fusca]|uniref:VapC45 PIN like domain-containing protein n=1 Tax=Trinickia fusca TaxID=2419777 RepID=A0A494X4C6_9BURK|nr:hypothetical protein [Trinickia fusca]RKP45548.1 hypothetical protein D7S89_19575 [Trinickia fusca]
MKYFFDNNLSPHLAHALSELSQVEAAVEAVVHLRDKFSPNAKDHDWITSLAAEGQWAVLSQDGLRKNDLERKALRESGLVVFVLHRQWAERRHWDKAQNLVRWWPALMEQSRRIRGGAAFRVPWRFGAGQFEQIRL